LNTQKVFLESGSEKMNKETETVNVTLELPKQLADFIKESWNTNNLQKTLTKEVIQLCFSQLDADANEESVFPEELINKYGLMPIFKQFVKEFKILPCYIKEASTK
jgi:hypothetical protein